MRSLTRPEAFQLIVCRPLIVYHHVVLLRHVKKQKVPEKAEKTKIKSGLLNVKRTAVG